MESSFQFTNPSLTGLEFGINEDFTGINGEEVSIRINMSVSIEKDDNKNQARVSLKVDLGEKGNVAPYYISVIETADFKWGEELDRDRADALLNQNAPALLLAYIRPIISQVTMASPFEAFNIPFMNFTGK